MEPEADACFDLVKLETSKCTIMHFLDDHAPISFQTYYKIKKCLTFDLCLIFVVTIK